MIRGVGSLLVKTTVWYRNRIECV